MAKTGKEKIILQIRCHTDVKNAFKVLAARMGKNYETTLILLLNLEKDQPLEKKAKGKIHRL